MLISQTQTYKMIANVTQSVNKDTQHPYQISLRQDEEMRAFSHYVSREYREGWSLKNSLWFIFQRILWKQTKQGKLQL